jgi:ABC-type multidrug transport system fused ATPase/permease subunit
LISLDDPDVSTIIWHRRSGSGLGHRSRLSVRGPDVAPSGYAEPDSIAKYAALALPRGFDTVLRGGGRELTQGQRQLIALARVLAVDPRVLILDEATASIDPATESAIQHALPQLIADRTGVIIAHRLQTVRDASRIAVLSGGEIADIGNHEQLMSRAGLYRKLYDALLNTADLTGE